VRRDLLPFFFLEEPRLRFFRSSSSDSDSEPDSGSSESAAASQIVAVNAGN
jgi:hypothetical protein